jgi:hypothetical protein
MTASVSSVLTASQAMSLPKERGVSALLSTITSRGSSLGASQKAAMRVVITTKVVTDRSKIWIARHEKPQRFLS